MEQIKLHTRQLVAEALTLMRNGAVNSLPVYDNGHFIGKITYLDLMAFLEHKGKTGNMYAHKLNFEVGTALGAIKQMKVDLYKAPSEASFTRGLVIGLSSVAAIAVVLLGLTWLFFNQESFVPSTQDNALTGLNKVMLTLANGENIPLDAQKKGISISDTEVKYNDGTEVDNPFAENSSVNALVEKNLMAVNTSNGGTYQLTLPDGTKVWLNAASSLRFPVNFASAGQRRVELSGEAYFEVAKHTRNARRVPFIVASEGQEIEVLGTHFNVSAYRNDEAVKTTLLEGSVRVRPSFKDKISAGVDPTALDPLEIEGNGRAGYNVMLKPNQEAILTGSEIKVNAVDAEEAIAWKNGDYIFRNLSLGEVMRTVSRWYDVDVVYKDKHTSDALLGGIISRDADLSEVLKMLEVTANVHFKKEGRRITVIE